MESSGSDAPQTPAVLLDSDGRFVALVDPETREMIEPSSIEHITNATKAGHEKLEDESSSEEDLASAESSKEEEEEEATKLFGVKVHDTLPETCANGACGGKEDLQPCTGCNAVQYCDEKCQADDWAAGHNTACSTMMVARNGRGRRRRGGFGGGRRLPVVPRSRRRRGFGRPRRRRGFGRGRGFGSGFGRGFQSYRRGFGLRRWFRPFLFPYWANWYPYTRYDTYGGSSGRLTSSHPLPRLPSIAARRDDPNSGHQINAQLNALRHQYAGNYPGYFIVPDLESWSFVWATRT